jgi:hypothetical protein
MVRLVFGSDPLTVPRVRLDTQTLPARLPDPLDMGRPLTLEIRPNELFEPRVADVRQGPRC